ncbi:hypothetical protein AB0H42_19475 [Nocardia sp. NPDC050799]|uniref:hypothetical protein n=1 Tax=Nocardia sp. NPDC050799 TaxID=3154842 RepID=UPI0033D60E08
MSSAKLVAHRALARLRGALSQFSRATHREYRDTAAKVGLRTRTAEDGDFALAERIRRDFGDSGAAATAPTVDRPLMLKGVDVLQQIAARYGDSIVFHGSPLLLTRIEPRQPSWKRGLYPDGDPAVCADKTFDIPLFMSMFKHHEIAYEPRTEGGMVYRVKGLDTGEVDLDATVGYVHILRRSDFSEVELPLPQGYPGPLTTRPPELRAFAPLQPLAVVEVRATDFPFPLLPK